MSANADQIPVEQLLAKMIQLTRTNNILRDNIKQLSETNMILARQDQDDKKAKKRRLPHKTGSDRILLDSRLEGCQWSH